MNIFIGKDGFFKTDLAVPSGMREVIIPQYEDDPSSWHSARTFNKTEPVPVRQRRFLIVYITPRGHHIYEEY